MPIWRWLFSRFRRYREFTDVFEGFGYHLFACINGEKTALGGSVAAFFDRLGRREVNDEVGPQLGATSRWNSHPEIEAACTCICDVAVFPRNLTGCTLAPNAARKCSMARSNRGGLDRRKPCRSSPSHQSLCSPHASLQLRRRHGRQLRSAQWLAATTVGVPGRSLTSFDATFLPTPTQRSRSGRLY